MIDIELKLPNNWLRSEIRGDEFVSSWTKEIWAIELDMLYKFMNICNKHNLKWWVDGGTLLGAVRHKGFIPWDDDIDVFMLREDYDKFIDIAKTEITGNYFLQTDWTDDTWFCHAKMRRTDTTAILDKDLSAKFNFNQGIFIDIFPFDNVPDNEIEYNFFMNELYLIKTEMLSLRSRWWLYERNNEELYKRCLVLRDEYESKRRKYNNIKCSHAANLGLPSIIPDVRKKISELNAYTYMTFEMLTVPVPAGYDSILKRLYGDYMEPVKGTSNHGIILFDPQISYKDTPMMH